jgi:hypothetical protein
MTRPAPTLPDRLALPLFMQHAPFYLALDDWLQRMTFDTLTEAWWEAQRRKAEREERHARRLSDPRDMAYKSAAYVEEFYAKEDLMSKKAKSGKVFEGLTDKQVERLLYEGICPNCANDECMNDGRGSLWCPACGEAYGEFLKDKGQPSVTNG